MRSSRRLSSIAFAASGVMLTAALPSGGPLGALGPRPAHASHYAFDRVELVSKDERRAFSRAGIFDTQMLLRWSATAKKRNWLADTTGISFERLTALATQCDLLRVEGIGPSIMEALQKAGIQHTQDLADAQAAALLERLRAATRGMAIHQRLPDTDTLSTWIRDARRLRPILEALPELDEPSR